MNILTYLSWVRKLWNTVVEIVKLIEETIPDDGAGKEKLAAFDIMLKAALEKADDIDESFDLFLLLLLSLMPLDSSESRE
jgi:hypothetical protein